MALTEAQELLDSMERMLTRDGRMFTLHPDFAGFQRSLIKASFSPSMLALPALSASPQYVDLDEELQGDYDRLKALVVAKMLDKRTVEVAKRILDAEHSQVDASHQSTDYETLSLPEKLVSLRSAQSNAREAEFDAFAITAISSVDSLNGLPLGSQTYHLPSSTSWEGLQRALTNMTNDWYAREAGYTHGYTVEHGKWLYQLSSDLPKKYVRDLASEADYRLMRRREAQEKGVIVWHELLWKASQRAREELDAERRAEVQRDDWVSKNGWVAWDPFVDPSCEGEVELGIAEIVRADNVRAPSVEPLSDAEQNPPPAVGAKRKGDAGYGSQRRTPKKAKTQTEAQDTANGGVERGKQGGRRLQEATPRRSRPQTRSAKKADISKGL